jgi:hypothetical protein
MLPESSSRNNRFGLTDVLVAIGSVDRSVVAALTGIANPNIAASSERVKYFAMCLFMMPPV